MKKSLEKYKNQSPQKSQSPGDEIYLTDELSITVYHPLYMFFPDQLNALIKVKESKLFSPNAVDLMFIPAFTTFIESILSEMFNDYLIKKQEACTDKLQARLLNNLDKDLLRGSWSTYKKNFELVFGKPMQKVVSQETMRAIESLYTFRNQCIHGKQISHEIVNDEYEIEEASLAGHYKNLNAYFLEKKLITKEELASITFINDKIISHFLENIKLFMSSMVENIMEVEQLRMRTMFKTYVLDKLSSSELVGQA